MIGKTKRKAINECEQLQKRINDLSKALDNLKLESMDTIQSLQIQLTGINARLETIQYLCGNTPIEDKVNAATNYEFGLEILKKQLTDQLIYIGGGDESLVTTIRFQSIEEVCRNTLTAINVLLQTNRK